MHVVNERLPPAELLDLLATHRARGALAAGARNPNPNPNPNPNLNPNQARADWTASASARGRRSRWARGQRAARAARAEAFDPRLHELGPAAIPPPAELTVEGLRALLDGLRPPAHGRAPWTSATGRWSGRGTSQRPQRRPRAPRPRAELGQVEDLHIEQQRPQGRATAKGSGIGVPQSSSI